MDDLWKPCSMGWMNKNEGKRSSSGDSPAAVRSIQTPSAQRLKSLLRASPPVPVGRIPGRYKLHLWRACGTQPYGITFGSNYHGVVVIAEDAPHFGLRKGDRVISLNGQTVVDVRQCAHLLPTIQDLEIQLYHREDFIEHPGDNHTPTCCWELQDLPVCCHMCFAPPESRCKAESFPIRDVLSTSGPVKISDDGKFKLQIVRMSREQPFGLIFTVAPPTSPTDETGISSHSHATLSSGCRPDGDSAHQECVISMPDAGLGMVPETTDVDVAMTIKQDLPHFGLKERDQILQINGIPVQNLSSCKAALQEAMTLTLEVQRHLDGHKSVVSFDRPQAKHWMNESLLHNQKHPGADDQSVYESI